MSYKKKNKSKSSVLAKIEHVFRILEARLRVEESGISR
jgi:hypothetical protein